MANPNNPFGFKPVKHLDGSPFNGASQLCFIPSSYATAVFVGDVVTLALPAANDPNGYGVPQVTQASNASTMYGVVVGFDPVLGGLTPNLYISYRPASVGQYAYVVNMTDAIFAVQLTGASSIADIGKNANLSTAVAGSTVSGLSGMQLDSSSIATTNTLQFHILALSLFPQGNVIGTNAVYEVVANTHQLAFSTAGV